jgi:hypothetical protein
MPVTATVTMDCLHRLSLLVLATSGDVTQIGLFLFLVALPKVAKASTIVAVACCCRRRNCLKFNANVNYP